MLHYDLYIWCYVLGLQGLDCRMQRVQKQNLGRFGMEVANLLTWNSLLEQQEAPRYVEHKCGRCQQLSSS